LAVFLKLCSSRLACLPEPVPSQQHGEEEGGRGWGEGVEQPPLPGAQSKHFSGPHISQTATEPCPWADGGRWVLPSPAAGRVFSRSFSMPPNYRSVVRAKLIFIPGKNTHTPPDCDHQLHTHRSGVRDPRCIFRAYRVPDGFRSSRHPNRGLPPVAEAPVAAPANGCAPGTCAPAQTAPGNGPTYISHTSACYHLFSIFLSFYPFYATRYFILHTGQGDPCPHLHS